MQDISSPVHRLPVPVKAGYGLGQIAGQLFRDAPSLLLLFYLTNIIGIAPAVAGLAIFVPKVFFGAVFDLGVGVASDRMIARIPRSRWLLLGALLSPLAMVATFAVPDTSLPLQLAYIVVTFSFYMFAFSTFSVPYLAQFADMSDSSDERTELMAWKHGFTGIGVLLGSAATPVIIHYLGGGRSAYITAAAFLGLISSVSLQVAWASVAKIKIIPKISTGLTVKVLLGVLSYRPFLILCISALVMAVAAGSSYATFAFFITHNMARPDAFVQIGIISTIMAILVMIGSPLWVFVARYLGKKNTYLFAAVGHSLVMTVWALSSEVPIWMIYVYAGLLGIFNSGWGLIVLSLLTDVIANAREEQGDDRAGSFAAVWSIIEKAGIALGGTLIAGSILSASGFDAGLAKQGISQSASALTGISMAYGFLPSVLKCIAALVVWRYVPTGKKSI